MSTLHSSDVADIIELLAHITSLHAKIERIAPCVAALVDVADGYATQVRRMLLRAALADIEIEMPVVPVAFLEAAE